MGGFKANICNAQFVLQVYNKITSRDLYKGLSYIAHL
jgi:hypothetical protein